MEKAIRLPQHVAFIMDGNGRWARQRGLSRIKGHQAGVETARRVIDYLSSRHISHVTLYSFSTENWNRPRYEVKALLRLLEKSVDRETEVSHRKGYRLRHLGNLEGLPPGLQRSIATAIEVTKDNSGLTVGLAFNYGSRQEIVEAARRIMAEGVSPQSVDQKAFNDHLYSAGMPDVDLMIRTGGEIRISNFLMWQAAYAELYFTPVLWPAFDEAELEKALLDFGQRQRRFGGLKSKDRWSREAKPEPDSKA